MKFKLTDHCENVHRVNMCMQHLAQATYASLRNQSMLRIA